MSGLLLTVWGLVIVHNQPNSCASLCISPARCHHQPQGVRRHRGIWGDDGLFRMPVFVVTHETHNPVSKGDTTFCFVTGGLEVALEHGAEADRALRR